MNDRLKPWLVKKWLRFTALALASFLLLTSPWTVIAQASVAQTTVVQETIAQTDVSHTSASHTGASHTADAQPAPLAPTTSATEESAVLNSRSSASYPPLLSDNPLPLLLAHPSSVPLLAANPSSEAPGQPNPAEVRPKALAAAQLALQQGKQFYDGGRFSDALDQWQIATRQAKRSEVFELQVRALRYQAIAHQRLSQWSEAGAALDQAQQLLSSASSKASPQASAPPEASSESSPQNLLQAQLLFTRGNLQLNQGQTRQALVSFEQAEQWYEQMGDRPGLILSRLSQAQALHFLGFHPRARVTLDQLFKILSTEPDSPLKGQTLRQFSDVLQSIGDLEQAEAMLAESQRIFNDFNTVNELAETLFQRGKIAHLRQQWQESAELYDFSRRLSDQPSLQIESGTQWIRVALNNPQSSTPEQHSLIQTEAIALLTQLEQLPPSRWKFYVLVNLSQSLLQLQKSQIEQFQIEQPQHSLSPLTSASLIRSLLTATQQAKTLRDDRATSYLLGALGTVYEQHHQYRKAQLATNQALNLARQLQANDITATWLWQTGRILKAQGQDAAAIEPYHQAVELFQDLRQDLIAMDPDVQFSFRDQVEPVYRQLVELLLKKVDDLPANLKQQRLEQARQTIEALQLAQVQNFLQEACETYAVRPIEQIDDQAAVFYPIVLGDRLEVVLALPGQPLQHYGSTLSQADQQQRFIELRQSLNPAFPARDGLPAAQQFYNQLIRPAEGWLAQQKIKTLVFVLDDFLQNVPMAVLHDGDRYLVEKYSLALTPGLQLFDAKSLADERLKVLAGGLSQARQGFSPLPGVGKELQSINQRPQAKLKAKVLLNQDFTANQLIRQVKAQSFNVLHLATHGQFSSQAKDTFLLTWNDRLGIEELDQWLNPITDGEPRSPIEMLILSACQTAKGDRRATLGLAGLAVRSGARSTLATLWSVQDQSTSQLIETFYNQLIQEEAGRAEALHQAQIALINSPDYSHPYYWAPFVLVGNWQ